MKIIQTKIKLYYDLLEIIENQDEVICKQNELISGLVNENLEKENMVNELVRQESICIS